MNEEKAMKIRNPFKKLTTLVIFFAVFIAGFSYGFAGKKASLPDIMKPEMIIVQGDRFFVVEGAAVFIYSLKNFKLLKKFGKRGEGPKEFKVNPPDNSLRIDVLPASIMVNSIGKISFFTLDGEFIKERNIRGPSYVYALGKNYVGETFVNEDAVIYRAFNLYNANLEKIKEIYRQKHILQQGRKIVIGKEVPMFEIDGDKVFVSGKVGLAFDIYDKDGKLLRSVKHPYKKSKVTDKDKKDVHEYLKMKYGEVYNRIKNVLEIADEFPVISRLFARNRVLYVSTNTRQEDKGEFFLFDSKGKLLKKFFLPMVRMTPLEWFPYEIQGNKLYQLVENEDSEAWDLHITEIKR
jgi:hypothetical protein